LNLDNLVNMMEKIIVDPYFKKIIQILYSRI